MGRLGTWNVQRARIAAVAALVVAIVLIAIVGFGVGSAHYTVHARFLDAGQLVKGDLVEIGGVTVGKVTALELTNDNQADVKLSISDDDFDPLHRGTVAAIRAVGLSGVANRFVELTPGPQSGSRIPDGGILRTSETRPIVDLDQLLDALDKPTRSNLQNIIKMGSAIWGTTPAQEVSRTKGINRAIAYLNPATAQARALTDELALDTAAFDHLVSSAAKVGHILATQRGEVTDGIANTAATLRQIARQRAALQSTLTLAPGVLAHGRRTLRNLSSTLTVVRPVLREAQPLAKPLANVLRQIVPTAERTEPVIRQLRTLLTPLKTAFDRFPGLARVAVPALKSAGTTVEAYAHIAKGTAAYGPDLIGGFVNGFGGTTGGYYDANGHFARISLQLGPDAASGLLSAFAGSGADLGGLQTHVVARCPGAAAGPAADKSNPYVPDGVSCDRKDDGK